MRAIATTIVFLVSFKTISGQNPNSGLKISPLTGDFYVFTTKTPVLTRTREEFSPKSTINYEHINSKKLAEMFLRSVHALTIDDCTTIFIDINNFIR